jgi:TM2 domain-containing membrane protein YozV
MLHPALYLIRGIELSTDKLGNPDTVTPSAVVSNDAIAMMKFESGKKSAGIAYLLWFFLGLFGAHRFYLNDFWMGILVVASVIIGFLLIFPLLVAFGILLYDLFTIPSQVRAKNAELMAEIAYGGGM